eukprot:TRINITY_DN3100_c0_g1_i1.p1 TRINITY_DN3100_c0_g1~~TRINITY_DN3100_c0_g1_i1.p1  ORF type:complete len:249 (-),score=41.06 TRINITY_DN3100_c0_g1_i1:208-954(-)
MATRDNTLVLFDIDGTLTPARKTIQPHMRGMLVALRKKVFVGVVGGSDAAKQKEQLGEDFLQLVDFNFCENGLIAYHQGELFHSKSILNYLGNDRLKQLINWTLRYVADLDIPIKRGTFFEYRTGLLNISPIGRNCSQLEREEFCLYNKEHKILEAMVAAMKKEFEDFALTFSIGGQISFDVFPRGWDKTYCLNHVRERNFKEIHFFGDKTSPGGNDFEIFSSDETIGHTVTSPEDTFQQVNQLWLSD